MTSPTDRPPASASLLGEVEEIQGNPANGSVVTDQSTPRRCQSGPSELAGSPPPGAAVKPDNPKTWPTLVVGQPENTSEREDTRVIFVHKGATTNGPPQTIDRPHPGSESGPPTAPLRWRVDRFLRFTIGVGLLGLPIWFLML